MFAKSPLMTLSELSANGIVSRIWSEPGQGVPRLDEVAQDRLQRPQVGHRVGLAAADHVRADVGEPVQRLQGADEQAPLLVEHVEARAEVVDDVGDPRPLVDQRAAEPLEGVDRPHDVGLLPVERADELVEVGQQGAQLRLVARRRRVELAGDRLDLLDTAAVEQQRQRAEHLLDLRPDVGAVGRDHRTGREAALRRVGGRGHQLDELLAEEAGLAQAGRGVGRQHHRAVDLDGDLGGPAVGRERDVPDDADGHVVDAHAVVRHEVDDVGELRRDRVGLGAERGAAGQREVLQGLEPAAGQGEERHHQQRRQRGCGAAASSTPSCGALTAHLRGLEAEDAAAGLGGCAAPAPAPPPLPAVPRRRRRRPPARRRPAGAP